MPLRKRSAPVADQYTEEFEDETLDDTPQETVQAAPLRGGWDTAKKRADEAKKNSSKYSYSLRVKEDPTLIGFVQGEPIDSFAQHWVQRSGQMSFRCLEDSCPLCQIGDNPTAKFSFWVVEFEIDGDDITPNSLVWTVGPRLFAELYKINEDKRLGGPLEDHFFTVYRTGKGPQTSYTINKAREADLVEEWGIDPAEAVEELATARAGEGPVLYLPTVEELRKVAAEARRAS